MQKYGRIITQPWNKSDLGIANSDKSAFRTCFVGGSIHINDNSAEQDTYRIIKLLMNIVLRNKSLL